MKNLQIPTTDHEYNLLLERVVKGAEYLENPIITENDYKKGLKLYDQLWNIARKYRMEETI
jgi:hypothetical protein